MVRWNAGTGHVKAQRQTLGPDSLHPRAFYRWWSLYSLDSL
jgi:hypothetical protein